MTLLRSERLELLRARRTELQSLVETFEHKSGNKAFIKEVQARISNIEQLIADVEHHRA